MGLHDPTRGVRQRVYQNQDEWCVAIAVIVLLALVACIPKAKPSQEAFDQSVVGSKAIENLEEFEWSKFYIPMQRSANQTQLLLGRDKTRKQQRDHSTADPSPTKKSPKIANPEENATNIKTADSISPNEPKPNSIQADRDTGSWIIETASGNPIAIDHAALQESMLSDVTLVQMQGTPKAIACLPNNLGPQDPISRRENLSQAIDAHHPNGTADTADACRSYPPCRV